MSGIVTDAGLFTLRFAQVTHWIPGCAEDDDGLEPSADKTAYGIRRTRFTSTAVANAASSVAATQVTCPILRSFLASALP